MQIVSWRFAWNVKAYYLGKYNKKYFKLLSAESFPNIMLLNCYTKHEYSWGV